MIRYNLKRIPSEIKNGTLSAKKTIADKNLNTDNRNISHLEVLKKYGWLEMKVPIADSHRKIPTGMI